MDTNDAFDPFSVSEIWAAQAGAFDEEGESPPALFAPFIADGRDSRRSLVY